jgi:hypothetical protein
MVYLAADNNLAAEMVYALTSMQSAASHHNYKVFALYDAGLGPALLTIPTPGPAGSLTEQADKSREQQVADSVKTTQDELKKANSQEQRLLTHDQQLKNAHATLVARLSAPPPLPPAARPDKESGTPPQVPAQTDAAIVKELQTTIRDTIDSQKKLKNAQHATQEAGKAFDAASKNQSLLDTFKKAGNDIDAMKALNELQPQPPASVRTTLTTFVTNTMKANQTDYYMLVLSGHGSGAVEDFLTGENRSVGLTIPELRGSLSDINKSVDRKIDILGLDSCLMGMAEVAYEVKDYVDFLVGAEGFEPDTGWPYDRVLNLLQGTPTPEQFAGGIVSAYMGFYSGDYTLAEVSTDLHTLDLRKGDQGLSKIERFAEALTALSNVLNTALTTTESTGDNIVLAHWNAQGFKFEQHVDVYDFCDLLQQRYIAQDPIWIACKNVKDTITDLVLTTDYCGPKFQYAKGVSIFFPWANITDAVGVRELAHYQLLEFAQKTKWDEFVTTCHLYTQRSAQARPGRRQLTTLNRREELFTGTPGRAGLPGVSKAGLPGVAKAGLPGVAKFASLASFDVFKIASMKNPPITWFKP